MEQSKPSARRRWDPYAVWKLLLRNHPVHDQDPAGSCGRIDRSTIAEFCEAIVDGDRPRARRELGLDLSEWPAGSEVDRAFPFYAARLRVDPAAAAWQGRAIVVRESEQIAGSANFKGAPQDGIVEVGYQLVCCEGPVFDARQVRWEEIP